MTNATLKLKPINKNSILNDTVESLQQVILGGSFHPGDLLPPENELGRKLGVSRTIIRETMRVLETRGLVEVGQGRPARVRGGNPEAVSNSLDVLLKQADHGLLDLLEVRRGLEGEAAFLAAQRAQPHHIQAMAQMIEILRLAEGNLHAMVEADLQFHEILAQSTGNPIFNIILRPLTKLQRASRERTIKAAGVQVPVAGHQAILNAIRRGAPSISRSAMLEHLDLAYQDIRRLKG
jgi:GntR family transcriptional regulator, transcriptional repressor for pyruvate dehydrogenase complex